MAGYYRPDVCAPQGGTKRCPQCWRVLPHPEAFRGLRGAIIHICHECAVAKSAYYREWRKRSRPM
ncbi:MAG: hypothetical protein KGK07_16000 [Chloroflexota bacterium]|nr:hypothetical protein [Chloroflexota bacterium]